MSEQNNAPVAKESKIVEGNKLIAKFIGMGDKFIQIDYEHERGVRYHSDWDWLMPVVEKINNAKTENIQAYIESDLNISRLTIFVDIKAVWLAVVEFIKWYNQTNNHEKEKSNKQTNY